MVLGWWAEEKICILSTNSSWNAETLPESLTPAASDGRKSDHNPSTRTPAWPPPDPEYRLTQRQRERERATGERVNRWGVAAVSCDVWCHSLLSRVLCRLLSDVSRVLPCFLGRDLQVSGFFSSHLKTTEIRVTSRHIRRVYWCSRKWPFTHKWSFTHHHVIFKCFFFC